MGARDGAAVHTSMVWRTAAPLVGCSAAAPCCSVMCSAEQKPLSTKLASDLPGACSVTHRPTQLACYKSTHTPTDINPVHSETGVVQIDADRDHLNNEQKRYQRPRSCYHCTTKNARIVLNLEVITEVYQCHKEAQWWNTLSVRSMKKTRTRDHRQ